MTNNADNNRGSMVFIQRQTASNSPTIDFINLTAYPAYYIVFSLIPVTNAVNLQMLVSNNNGSSYAGAGSYAGGVNYNLFNTGTLTNSSSANFFPLAISILNSQTVTGFLYCTNMVASGTAFQHSGQTVWNNGTNISFGVPMGQSITGINAIRFQMSSGNINSGSISVYGYGIP